MSKKIFNYSLTSTFLILKCNISCIIFLSQVSLISPAFGIQQTRQGVLSAVLQKAGAGAGAGRALLGTLKFAPPPPAAALRAFAAAAFNPAAFSGPAASSIASKIATAPSLSSSLFPSSLFSSPPVSSQDLSSAQPPWAATLMAAGLLQFRNPNPTLLDPSNEKESLIEEEELQGEPPDGSDQSNETTSMNPLAGPPPDLVDTTSSIIEQSQESSPTIREGVSSVVAASPNNELPPSALQDTSPSPERLSKKTHQMSASNSLKQTPVPPENQTVVRSTSGVAVLQNSTQPQRPRSSYFPSSTSTSNQSTTAETYFSSQAARVPQLSPAVFSRGAALSATHPSEVTADLVFQNPNKQPKITADPAHMALAASSKQPTPTSVLAADTTQRSTSHSLIGERLETTTNSTVEVKADLVFMQQGADPSDLITAKKHPQAQTAQTSSVTATLGFPNKIQKKAARDPKSQDTSLGVQTLIKKFEGSPPDEGKEKDPSHLHAVTYQQPPRSPEEHTIRSSLNRFVLWAEEVRNHHDTSWHDEREDEINTITELERIIKTHNMPLSDTIMPDSTKMYEAYVVHLADNELKKNVLLEYRAKMKLNSSTCPSGEEMCVELARYCTGLEFCLEHNKEQYPQHAEDIQQIIDKIKTTLEDSKKQLWNVPAHVQSILEDAQKIEELSTQQSTPHSPSTHSTTHHSSAAR